MTKIRILMVLASTNIGGAEMFVLNLLRNIDLSRFQVDLVASFKEKSDGLSKEIKALDSEIYYLPYFKVYNYFQYVKAWDKFLTKHHYDIVHGHATNSASIYLRVAKKHGCITIAHCHSAGFRGNGMQRMLKRFFASGVTKVADYWFACSEKAAEHLYGNNYLNYKNYYTIPNAINAEKYMFSNEVRDRIRQELNIHKDSFVCGHVGSLTGPKNHTFLLDIFASVLSQKPEAKLLLCGEGPLRAEVEGKAERLGIKDKVIFRGIVKNVNEYLMSMDVFIFPSIFEGFGISVLEAEATGLPVVISETIPNEVVLMSNVKRCSLSDTPSKWADVVFGMENADRRACNQIICDSKYNMSKTVNMIMSLYDYMVNNQK